MLDLRTTYSRTEFAGLVARETSEIELKSGIRRRALQEVMVAFSNTTGGVIFLGVNDDRSLRGVVLTQHVQDAIDDSAHDAHDIETLDVLQVAVEDQPVVAVRVHPRLDGFAQTSDGRVLVRKGARNRALIGPELRRWLTQRELSRLEASVSDASVSDCDPVALAELVDRHGWDPDSDDLAAHLFERLLATPHGQLTVAGALLLTDPATSLRTTKLVIDIRGYENDEGSSFVRRDLVGGPVYQQVRHAAMLVSRDLGQDAVVLGVHRHDLPRIPLAVVREVIANAVAHRSYEDSGSAIIVELRPSWVTVRSPGPLPAGVRVQRLRQAQKARNPILIDELRRFELSEDSGLGIDLIQDEMRAAFLQEPTFSDDGTSVTVTLPRRALLTARERAWIDELESRGALTAAERELLTAAARGEILTNARARAITRIDSIEARRALHRLRDRGLLQQHGARGGATYSLGDVSPHPGVSAPGDPETLVLAAARAAPITNSTVRELTGLDRTSALGLLRRLVQEGRLAQRGARRGTSYTADEGNAP